MSRTSIGMAGRTCKRKSTQQKIDSDPDAASETITPGLQILTLYGVASWACEAVLLRLQRTDARNS
jgi:hypothetical protein